MYRIYKIVNKINGKIYIGLTSKSVYDRWCRHLMDCKFKKRKKVRLYNAIMKYGEKNFIIEEIYLCKNKNIAYEKEKYYIKLYNSYDENIGYNMTIGGDGINGYIFSEEDKKRISDKVKGELNGFYGRKHTKQTIDKIKNTLRGKLSGSNHPLWGTHCSKETKLKMSKSLKGRIIDEVWRKHMSDGKKGEKSANNKKVLCYDKKGNFIKEYYSILYASNMNNICRSSISLVCVGKRKTAGGYIWRYKEII